MHKYKLFAVIMLVIAGLTVPVVAQDSEVVTVTGTFDYTPTITVWEDIEGTSFIETTEVEEWIGDIVGVGASEDRITILPSGAWEAWIITTFDEVTIGDKSGGMVTMSIWKKPAASAHWHGEWVILRGTGDLVNAHGGGSGWGPGFNPEAPEASPDIYYWGKITFVESSSN